MFIFKWLKGTKYPAEKQIITKQILDIFVYGEFIILLPVLNDSKALLGRNVNF